MTVTLTEFLLARVGEDEAAARVAQHIPEAAMNITRWHPARVLADCEAKRRIVELHSYDWNPRGLCMACDVEGPCPTLRALALPSIYAEHLDFDPAWRP